VPLRYRPLTQARIAALGLATVALAGCAGSATHAATSSLLPTPTASTGAGSARPHPGTVTVRAESTTRGTVLASSRGFVLYTYARDGRDKSVCTGPCATTWPPFTVRAGTRLVSTDPGAGAVGVLDRPGGGLQVSFRGHPLYFFSGDRAPGQTNGEGIEGVWSVVPLGSPTPSTAATPGTGAPAATSGPPAMSSSSPAPMATTPAPVRSPTRSAPPSPVASTSTAPTTPSPRPSSSSPGACPPQGGGGDGDADNSGGPSDGDGCT